MKGSPGTLATLVAELFQPALPSRPDGSMGAELELIPVRNDSRRRVGIAASGAGPGTAEVARDAARARGWVETVDTYGAPRWNMPGGGRLCYEPGGQFEIISPVLESSAGVGGFLRDTLSALRSSATAAGISLLAVGVDPWNDIDSVPLELHAPRYDAMAGYFNALGPSGARMMRQTASFHVNVELGPKVMERWTLLNSLAPYLVAAFANSTMHAGAATGFASYRSQIWRTLDPTRTGLAFGPADPVGAYTRFAKAAGRILEGDEAHLTTLFPEIRPRGYFEIRSLDSMEPDRFEQALEFISAIIQDGDVAAEAARITGAPDAGLLSPAARYGRAHPQITRRLEALERLAGESPSAARSV